MRLALVDGKRVEAQPGLIGNCPGCGGPMRAKCGEVLTWHWAHLNAECDPWSEPESEWHLAWKARFPEQYQEVVIGPHRADVKGPGAVLEVQRSAIEPAMIREREEFYGEMLWMLKGEDFKERFSTRYLGQGVYAWEWKRPRQTWGVAERRLLIDFGEIFEITRINSYQTPWNGRGRYVSGSELYQTVCGEGVKLVKHEWYLLNAAQHANRLQREQAHDERVEREREAERLLREKQQRQQDELEREWWKRAEQRAAEEAQREQKRIAEDLARQAAADVARRKSDEEFERFLAEQRDDQARQERLRLAEKRAFAMYSQVQWYALEQQRGVIYGEILKRRPYPIKDVGLWSTPDLQDLLLSLERRKITADFCQSVNQRS
jgi:competence protein CoiA